MGLKLGTCATCAFFEDVHQECRVNPPRTTVATANGLRWTSQWPRVDANDWCGRYYDARIKGQRKTYARQINDGDIVPVDIFQLLKENSSEDGG